VQLQDKLQVIPFMKRRKKLNFGIDYKKYSFKTRDVILNLITLNNVFVQTLRARKQLGWNIEVQKLGHANIYCD
jgi:hypothetical protein